MDGCRADGCPCGRRRERPRKHGTGGKLSRIRGRESLGNLVETVDRPEIIHQSADHTRIEHAVAAAHHRLIVDLVREAEARREVVVRRVDIARLRESRIHNREIRHVRLIPPDSHIHHQLRRDPPLIGHVPGGFGSESVKGQTRDCRMSADMTTSSSLRAQRRYSPGRRPWQSGKCTPRWDRRW